MRYTNGWLGGAVSLCRSTLHLSGLPTLTATMAAKQIDRQFHNVPGAYRSLDIL